MTAATPRTRRYRYKRRYNRRRRLVIAAILEYVYEYACGYRVYEEGDVASRAGFARCAAISPSCAVSDEK